MKRKWKRALFGSLIFSSAAFVFQACYGAPGDFGYDVFIEGHVISKSSKKPIRGIKVSITDEDQYAFTDVDGRFSFYTYERKINIPMIFQDVDSVENSGLFETQQLDVELDSNKISLNIEMGEENR
ncbi:MAG: carboxypeptidase-like regulatory domain-containing protein [Bacteroidales bacterium]|jgi:hypothetical protein|nr:carboxypeptidase-like regulatory domain-containing protein [Bacteroidales bacterium]